MLAPLHFMYVAKYEYTICDLPRENRPSSHLVIFQEIPFQNIKLIKTTCCL